MLLHWWEDKFMAGVFNPFGGGRIVTLNPLGGLLNQGAVGIQTGNSLQQAFGDVIKWCDPYREKMSGLGATDNNTIQVGAHVPWKIRTAWRNWMLGSSTTRLFNMPGGGDGVTILQGGGINIGAQGNVLVAGGVGVPGQFIPQPGFQPPVVVPAPPPVPSYYITRACPYQCPDIGNETFYCTAVDLDTPAGAQGFDIIPEHDAVGNITGPGDKWINFSDSGSAQNPYTCKYLVTFSQLPYEVRSDAEIQQTTCNAPEMERYLERQPRGAVQSLPLPSNVLPIFTNQISPFQGGGVYNDISGKIVGQGIPTSGAYILSQTEELLYIWEQVPDPPWNAIAACIGKTNAATFDGARGWPSFTAGTVMFNGPLEKKRYRHASGRWYWRITYSFLWRPQGVNYFPVADGTYLLVTFNGSPIYPSADFTTLFQPGAPPSLAWPNWKAG
jgi:hypothetical protein